MNTFCMVWVRNIKSHYLFWCWSHLLLSILQTCIPPTLLLCQFLHSYLLRLFLKTDNGQNFFLSFPTLLHDSCCLTEFVSGSWESIKPEIHWWHLKLSSFTTKKNFKDFVKAFITWSQMEKGCAWQLLFFYKTTLSILKSYNTAILTCRSNFCLFLPQVVFPWNEIWSTMKGKNDFGSNLPWFINCYMSLYLM